MRSRCFTLWALASFLAYQVLAAPVAVKLVSQDYASNSVIYDLGDARYMTPMKNAVAVLSSSAILGEKALKPAVALYFDKEKEITKKDVEGKLKWYYEKDDVLSPEFLGSIVLSTAGPASLADDAVAYLENMETDAIYMMGAFKSVPKSKKVTFSSTKAAQKSTKYPLEGPYLTQPCEDGLSLYLVYRLYLDDFRTFVLWVLNAGFRTKRYRS